MAKPVTSTAKDKNRSFYPYYIAIVILSFVFYGNSLKNEYSMDDNLVTSTYESKHPTIEGGISAIPEIFTSHYVVNAKQSYAYRPITTSSFAIEYQLFGQNPFISHLINILLYALVILVLFKLLNAIWGEDKYFLTVLTCLIFLIHPIHSEVINNIKCRDEILSSLFGLLSLNYTLKAFDLKNNKLLMVAALFIILSMLSKPTGIIFIAVIPLTLYFFREISLKKIIPIAGALVAGYLIYKGSSKLLLDDPVSRVKFYFENPLYYMGFAERIPMFFYTIFYYVTLLFFPYPLRYYYGYDQVPIADWGNPIVYLMIVLLFGSMYIMIKRIKKKDIWAYGVWFFLLGIGGASNLLFPVVGIIAERFAFIASIGFSISIAFALYHFVFEKNAKFKQFTPLTNVVLAIITLVTATYSFQRNKVWKDDVSLYKHDIQYLEKSFKANTMLGQAYYNMALGITKKNLPLEAAMPYVDSCEFYLKNSLAIYKDYHITYNNLGALNYTYKGRIDTALYYFQKAVDIDSNYLEANFNLANLELWKFKTNQTVLMVFNQLNTSEAVSANDPIQTSNNFNQIVAVSELLERIRTPVYNIPVSAASGANSDTMFAKNIRELTLNVLGGAGLTPYFNQIEFDQKIISNFTQIVDSYNKGTLSYHLFDYVSYNICKNYYQKQNSTFISPEEICSIAKTNVNYYANVLEPRLYKCLSLDSSYYPPYNKLQEYYQLTKNFKKMIEFNEIASTVSKFNYHHEFYSNAAKASYQIGDSKGALKFMKLAVEDLDKNIKDIDSDNTTNQQELENKKKIRPQLVGQRISMITSIVSLAKDLGYVEDVEKYAQLLQSSK
ncbi:MAG: glycosyltransferase family 39 protein [Flavobacteriales bacterium]|nr:glycosyltransferase family 39 protein [Flavobacteriales bacterium]